MGAQMEAIDNLPDASEGGNVGGYNFFWMDPELGCYASAMKFGAELVYPEDGQLPMRLGARAKLGQFFLRVQGAFDGPEQRPLGSADRWLWLNRWTTDVARVVQQQLSIRAIERFSNDLGRDEPRCSCRAHERRTSSRKRSSVDG